MKICHGNQFFCLSCRNINLLLELKQGFGFGRLRKLYCFSLRFYAFNKDPNTPVSLSSYFHINTIHSVFTYEWDCYFIDIASGNIENFVKDKMHMLQFLYVYIFFTDRRKKCWEHGLCSRTFSDFFIFYFMMLYIYCN